MESRFNSRKPAVNALFFKRLAYIMRICVPSWKSQEAINLALLSICLTARSFLTVGLAQIAGAIAQSIVGRNWRRFGQLLYLYFFFSIPISAANSGLDYFVNILSLEFRNRLTQHINDVYIKGLNFYKANNLNNNRIDNIDQRVTADVDRFSSMIANFYSTLSKPILDVILLTYNLWKITGWQGPVLIHSYFFITGFIKRKIMPSFGRMISKESELEGTYRSAHMSLISNSEEIAFYDGSDKEKKIINKLFDDLYKHESRFAFLKGIVGIFDGLLIKYWATIIGYGVMSSPLILNTRRQGITDATLLFNDYIKNSVFLMNLTTSVGQLVLAGNKLMQIAGLTARVSELLESIKELNNKGIEPFKVIVDSPPSVEVELPSGKELVSESSWKFLDEWRDRMDAHRVKQMQQEITESIRTYRSDRSRKGGRIEKGDIIKFNEVDIVSPEGKLLVHNLSFEVKRGCNVMVVGPNGSGKSSLFRVIGELWPLHCGTITKPRNQDILFVPQKPYQVFGTFRDQIIYPHTIEQMRENGVSDSDLQKLLHVVDPYGTIQSGWDEQKNWPVFLTGGQKQRVAMARLFYHKPLFAILDECTSSVSGETEGTIYETCKKLGITLFTVSHRPQLKKYHDFILRFEGREGKWSWEKIESEK